MQQTHFKFLSIGVTLESEWPELTSSLEKDFWAFIEPHKSNSDFTLKIVNSSDRPHFPEMRASSQSQNAISYDDDVTRFSDYYGEAYTIINFSTNDAILYSDNLGKAHEIAYLLILSRVGKKLDLLGYHKLHAFAVSFNQTALVCMMPSKGGKSTLLVELLKDPRIKMISDDIPLVSSDGNIFSFPLKLGLNCIPESLEILDKEKNIYEMKRSLYGIKKLVCTRGLGEKVINPGACFRDVILISAQRFNSRKSNLKDESWVKSFKELFKHGIIGLGTPIILEYFWEKSWKDFFTRSNIFIRRMIGFYRLSIKSKKLNLELGIEPTDAAIKILNYLELNKN